MRTIPHLLSTLLLTSATLATSLTFKLSAHDKSCFFADVANKGSKVAFYFAVQAGGSFDVDYSVTGPNERIVFEGKKERQGDFVFTAETQGEYRFCFNNEFSTLTDKTVDFEITVRFLSCMHFGMGN